MTVIRTISWAFALGCALACFSQDRATAQSAGSKAAILSQCEELMKAEFGEAEFAFNKIRRAEGNKQFAFGELTLTDGTKRSVRCALKRGQVSGVEFRTGNTSTRAAGAFWSNDRPAGAEFVPPKEETEEVAATDATGDTAPQSPTEDAPTEPDAETTTEGEPAEVESTESETSATTETTESTTEGEADATQSADATTEEEKTTDDQDDDPANFTPVFRRVN